MVNNWLKHPSQQYGPKLVCFYGWSFLKNTNIIAYLSTWSIIVALSGGKYLNCATNHMLWSPQRRKVVTVCHMVQKRGQKQTTDCQKNEGVEMFQCGSVIEGGINLFTGDLPSFARLMQRNAEDVISDYCPLVEAQHNSFES